MQSLTSNQKKAVADLKKIDSKAEFFPDEKSGIVEFAMGTLSKPSADSPESIARDFLKTWEGLLDLKPGLNQKLKLVNNETDKEGYSHLSFAQIIDGIPVFEGSTQIHLDPDGRVIAYKDYRIREVNISTAPAGSAEDAAEMAKGLGGKNDLEIESHARLIFFRDRDKQLHLAWDVELAAESDLGSTHYFIDAHNRQILYSYSESREAMTRLTYSAQNKETLPGRLILGNNVRAEDQIARSAHDFALEVYNYYKEKFGRDSYDDRGADLVSTVHYGENYNNAFWSNRFRQMVYGDGDGQRWKPLALALDIVAHELTHAVTSRTARFVYAEQAGALDEAFADIFAVFISNDGPITDWQVGEGVYTPFKQGDALRDLSNPSRFHQPDHMDGFMSLEEGERPDANKNDHGYVHFNSGIVNKAAYLLISGGKHHGIEVEGLGKEKAERIYYMALTKYLSSATASRWTFKEARHATLNACRQLFGDGGQEYGSVKNAWAAVGVGEPAEDFNIVRLETSPNQAIPDNDPSGIRSKLHVERAGLIKDISVTVLIMHGYIGDLRIALVSPAGHRVVLHDREGMSARDLSKTYDLSNTPSFQTFLGEKLDGDWSLEVADRARLDEGNLVAWELKLTAQQARRKTISLESSPNLDIPDNTAQGIENRIRVEQTGKLLNADFTVDISHSWIGDLEVILVSPVGKQIVLHERSGNSRKDLFRTWSTRNDPDLQSLVGKDIQGDWKLKVRDLAAQDTGTLNRWSINFVYD